MADIKMPKLGESVTEGTLGKWLKQVGDYVQKYEPLVEVVTDKVNAEIPSDFEGTLTEILVKENETVKNGTIIAKITEAAEEAVAPSVAVVSVESVPSEPASNEVVITSQAAHGRFSPLVLKLAAEHQVDLNQVHGTGLGGRITRKDVLAHLDNKVQEPAVSASNPPVNAPSVTPMVHNNAAAVSEVAKEVPAREEWIAVTPIRKTIATRMVESKHEAPHAWMMMEVDATPVVKLREKHKLAFRAQEGVDLTFLPFFIKAAVEALKEFPLVNAMWAGDKIIVKKDVNISIAVATADALVVPVLHHADRLSILGLASGIADLAKRARANQLRLEDVQGGTFTVNNTGAFGSVLSQPIINAPQAAILTVEAIVKRPVVQKDDSIAIRSMINLCMSLDHRVLDGWVSGQFLRSVKERIESVDDSYRLY
jgi:2-oxoisovalerate dehydrogenase E2 component (dihydrolipoyl transacylase)